MTLRTSKDIAIEMKEIAENALAVIDFASLEGGDDIQWRLNDLLDLACELELARQREEV